MDRKILAKLFTAYSKTIVLFGTAHIAYLIFLAVITGKWQLLNVFVVLDLHEVAPQILTPPFFLLSYAIFIAVFIYFFWHYHK